MSLDSLVSLANIVNALAVTLTLVVLVIAIRQNAKAQKVPARDKIPIVADSFRKKCLTFQMTNNKHRALREMVREANMSQAMQRSCRNFIDLSIGYRPADNARPAHGNDLA
jgi:RecG-like helicase